MTRKVPVCTGPSVPGETTRDEVAFLLAVRTGASTTPPAVVL
jgi:hypothetical protein